MIAWLKRVFSTAEPEPPSGDPARIAEVEAVLAELRPYFLADGGDIRLMAIEGDRVRLRMFGACTHCSASSQTLFDAIEPELARRLAWFAGIDVA